MFHDLVLVLFFFIWYVLLNSFVCSLQYPDYVDAYLRLAAIAKARNNVQLSIELVKLLLTYNFPASRSFIIIICTVYIFMFSCNASFFIGS